jgi:hypothetical protein
MPRYTAFVLLSLLAAAGCGSAAATRASVPVPSSFTAVKAATATYRNVARATDASYQVLDDAKGITCIANSTAGVGIQYVDPTLLTDATVEPNHPEGLLYDPTSAGRLRFDGVEYIVDQAKWDGRNLLPPRMFGQTFQLNPAGNRYGLAPFYELRVWLWNDNPLGVFDAWNSTVGCVAPPRNFN